MEKSELKKDEHSSGEDKQEETKEKGSEVKLDKIKALMLAFKAMTAMKLTRDDNEAAEIVPGLFLGSVGVAFNKESLTKYGITHILTCADKI